MITQIRLPHTEESDLSQSEEETFVTVVEWLKQEGEPVMPEQDLLLVEVGGKAVFAIKSERSGVLLKMLVQTGEDVDTDRVFGLIGDSVEEGSSPDFSRELKGLAQEH